MYLKIIDYFLILLSTVCLYNNLIGKKSHTKHYIIYCGIFLITSIIFTKISSIISVYLLLLILLVCIINGMLIDHVSFKYVFLMSLITTSLLFGIRIICYIIPAFFYALDLICEKFASSLSEFLTLITVNLIFKIKRLSKGMTFIKENEYYTLFGIIIGAISVATIFFAGIFINNTYIVMGVVFSNFAFALLLILWWQSSLTMSYLQKRCQHDVSILESQVVAHTNEINRLQKELDRLSSIIHKDNKLIPAMINAVNSISEGSSDSKELLNQLNELACERKGILSDNTALKSNIRLSGELRTDAILKYIEKRAEEISANFHVDIYDSYKNDITDFIGYNDICTLIADLCENALIATKAVNNPNVLLTITRSEDELNISIFDNGPAFSRKVLNNIGKKRITTHKKEGGSGIGLMTMAEILNRYNATYEINEKIVSDTYKKVITLHFFTKTLS